MLKTPDMSLQHDMVLQHMPLVRKIAGHLFSLRSFDGVPFEDYVQLGAEGLIQAVQRYDASLGARFETYAAHRIKGAIVSGLEKATEVNQQVSTLRRLRQERMVSIGEGLPSPAAVPATPDGDEADAALMRLIDASLGLAVAFMLEDTSLFHPVHHAHSYDGASNVAYKQLQLKLRQAVLQLSDAERQVLEQHYFGHDSFDLIAQHLSLSRSRVSQLHRGALQRLRALLHTAHMKDFLG